MWITTNGATQKYVALHHDLHYLKAQDDLASVKAADGEHMMSNKKSKPDLTAETAEPKTAAAGEAQFAQASVDQFEAAFDKAAEVAHGNVQVLDASASAFKTSAADLQMKVLEIAQANVGAAFGFTRELFKVTEPMAFFKLHQEFVQAEETPEVIFNNSKDKRNKSVALKHVIV